MRAKIETILVEPERIARAKESAVTAWIKYRYGKDVFNTADGLNFIASLARLLLGTKEYDAQVVSFVEKVRQHDFTPKRNEEVIGLSYMGMSIHKIKKILGMSFEFASRALNEDVLEKNIMPVSSNLIETLYKFVKRDI